MNFRSILRQNKLSMSLFYPLWEDARPLFRIKDMDKRLRFNKKYYLCSSCKRVFHTHEDLLFVEDNVARGFCTETCIEQFFRPQVKLYEAIEVELREKLSIKDEITLKFLESPQYLEKLLKGPKEIWAIENDFNEKIYSLIAPFKDKSGKTFYLACLCLFYQGKPSFIFLVTATSYLPFLEEFRIGERVNLRENESLLKAPEYLKDSEVANLVEHKKSFLLSELLRTRSTRDIPIFDFPNYEQFMKNTVEGPDEVYAFKDDLGDKFITYIKSYQEEKNIFYYFVICLTVLSGAKSNKEQIVPVIFFPSKDGKIYQMFTKGNLIMGSLKS